ncbi:hypothetical protein HDV01_005074 [Terramyces sp. JEL0728]|nr:hypothetical protein HDV01_005074 [Terramyces sp. JEL0728]
MHFPPEIQLRILSFIERPNYILPGGISSKNSPHTHTLNQLCRIKSWNRTATEELYKYVRIETHNLVLFIYGILASSNNDQLESFALELGPQLAAVDPEIIEGETFHYDDLKSGTREFERRLNVAIAESDKLRMIPIATRTVQGNGLKFNHPVHGPDFLPTLAPSIVLQSRPYISQLQNLSVNDVHKNSWPLLLDALKQEGYNLKVLSLEACSELEPFTSKIGLSTIFPALRNLECLRLDGVPVNSYDFTWGGDFDILILTTLCPNLTAVALDYCDLTMESFYTIWNNCDNLEFLGIVGLTNETDSVPEFKMKHRLKTLRFVDCQINDSILETSFSFCPNLSLLRVVFEFPAQFSQNWNPHTSITDRTLLAVSKYCRNLKTLAISKTNNMSSKGFQAVLEKCPIEVLDFHCNTQSDNGIIGVLDEEFLLLLIPAMKNVRVLNLYEQTAISQDIFLDLIQSNLQLQSLCLSGCTIDFSFLAALLHIPTSIRQLSLACDIKMEDYQWFVNELVARNKTMEKIYTNLTEAKGTLVYPDTWFTDQKLDIFSLWNSASTKHLEESARKSGLRLPSTASLSKDRSEYSKPAELCHFSYDDTRKLSLDSNQALSSYDPKPLPYNLYNGYPDDYTQREEVEEHLDALLLAVQNTNIPKKPSFVTWRGIMTLIVCTPYQQHEDWELNASLVDGTIYLEQVKTLQKDRPDQAVNMYYGYKFEACFTSPMGSKEQDKISVNTNIQYCSVFQARLAKHNLVLGGEVDCISKNNYCELKTHKEIENEKMDYSFRKYKLLKTYIQSYLAGVVYVVFGFKRNQEIVELREYRTDQLPGLCRELWNRHVCFNFGKMVLDFISKNVTVDDRNTVYKVRYNSRDRVVEISEPEKGKFVWDWYKLNKQE